MVSPRVKFIAITIDELLLVPVAMALAFYFIPDWFVPITMLLIFGAIVFVVGKYYLVYPALLESSYAYYDLKGLTGKVIEPVTERSGKIKVGAEIWDARTDSGAIDIGTEVRVVSRESMKVRVRPLAEEDGSNQ